MEDQAVQDLALRRFGPRQGQPQEALGPPPHVLPRPSPPSDDSFLLRGKEHLLQHVRPSLFAEIELLILTFCTGLQDAVSFPDYHCFASNQTGNTVFLAVALVVPQLNGIAFLTANAAVSLGFFLIGGYVTGQLSHLVGPRLRIWLILCNLFQTLLVFAAAAIQRHYGVQPTGTPGLLVVSLLAFASGSQVVQSRSLRMTEISTAMATAAWVDLLIDPHLMTVRHKNRPRDRRIAFLIALFAGSLVGAGIYKITSANIAIFVSGSGKAVVTSLYLFNVGEESKGQTEVTGDVCMV
ncbi:hypothetical protein BD289DRAFT_362290 [Coniella lustricola]|uniref:DUF1275 domain protein n=1 Tax=Coniella lustricola TaxID=2025994 RepID=A0A2T3AH06_9PEZI|nr:hypothetical protein BD289DRAFT_362290 [Coniella lustricola]